MVDVTKSVIRSVNIIDAVGIAGFTILSKQTLGRVFKNKWLGAGVKIGGAVGLNSMKLGKVADYASAGLLIDGATDVANGLLHMVGLNGVKVNNNMKPQVL